MKQSFLIFYSILFSLSFSLLASAQTVSIPGQIPELEEQISVYVDPLLPGPHDTINIRLEAYGTDLTRATVTWKVNGVVKKAGRGELSFSLSAGAAGTTQQVSITIQTINGPVVEKQLTFKPQEVDLVWESRGYTPPFYKGKAMTSFMGETVIVALPNFKSGSSALSRNNLTYRWKKNGDVLNEESGFMKNSVSVKGGILLRNEEITVEVFDDTGNKADESIEIEYFKPYPLFYENSPLYGILFNREASNISLKNSEVSLTAFPYFFDAPSRESGVLNYTWRVNGQESFLFTGDTATFRYDDEAEGTSAIDMTIKNSANFLQEANVRSIIELQENRNSFNF